MNNMVKEQLHCIVALMDAYLVPQEPIEQLRPLGFEKGIGFCKDSVFNPENGKVTATLQISQPFFCKNCINFSRSAPNRKDITGNGFCKKKTCEASDAFLSKIPEKCVNGFLGTDGIWYHELDMVESDLKRITKTFNDTKELFSIKPQKLK